MSKEGIDKDNPSGEEVSIEVVPIKKRKLTQSTLGTFVHSSLEEILVAGSEKILDLSRVEVSNFPTWGTGLIPYFKVIHVDTLGKWKKYKMQCLLCEAENKQTLITDKRNGSFTRHLERFHPVAFQQMKAATVNSDSNSAQNSRLQTSNHQHKYLRAHPKQKQFEKDLVNLVVTDCVPFQIVEGDAFKTTIFHLDERIMIPHRTTLQRWMTEDYKKSILGMKNELRGMLTGSLHFIMDIWTSQQRQSIIGFKVQFVKDWKLRQLVVGFKHFPESHTAENIISLLETLIIEELGLVCTQVGSVTADNASNILAAFKVSNVSGPAQADECLSSSQNKINAPDNHNANEGNEVAYRAIKSVFHASNSGLEDDRILDELETLADAELETNVDDSIPKALVETFETLTGKSLKRNACLAHLLQLAIRDSTNSSTMLVAVSKKVNDIVRFINNSNKSLAELRSKTGLSLVKPCVTRWNSLYYCFQRLLRDDKCKMHAAINEVLASAKSCNKRSKVPVSIYDEDIDFIRCAVALLKPFADLTNSLQADSVTSSLVLLGLINAIKETTDVTVDEDIAEYESLLNFQKALCENVANRFAHVKLNSKDSSKSRGRPIVTVNVFQDPNYIIATLLDCRIRKGCFNCDLVKGTVLEGKLPTCEKAMDILRQVFASENRIAKIHDEDLKSSKTPQPGPNFSTSKKTMFSLVSANKCNPQVIQDSDANTELEKYLQLEPEVQNAETMSPLSFWYKNEESFPRLCKFAMKYLSMPAEA